MSELVEFARHEFRLGKRGKDGKSLRETLEVVERMTGRMPEEGVNPAEFPDVLFDLWQWFCSLNAARQQGMAVSPIAESEIGWFFRNRGLKAEEWQLRALRVLDRVALDSAGE